MCRWEGLESGLGQYTERKTVLERMQEALRGLRSPWKEDGELPPRKKNDDNKAEVPRRPVSSCIGTV